MGSRLRGNDGCGFFYGHRKIALKLRKWFHWERGRPARNALALPRRFLRTKPPRSQTPIPKPKTAVEGSPAPLQRRRFRVSEARASETGGFNRGRTQHHTKPDVADAIIGIEPEAISTARTDSMTVPRAAAHHPQYAAGGLKIFARGHSGGGVGIAKLRLIKICSPKTTRPFKHVADHIVQPAGGRKAAHQAGRAYATLGDISPMRQALGVITPRENRVAPAARGLFPFQFAGQRETPALEKE